MKKCCKNCIESICIQGRSSKVYICKMNPINKDKLKPGMYKFAKVDAKSHCDDYMSRIKED